MKRMKIGIVALVIAMLAITAAVVGAQPGNGGNNGGGRGGFGGRSVELQVVADALGLDLTALQTELQAGKTIADIATEQDVELSTVVDAVVATRQEALATAVTDGTITQAQADAQIALLTANLEAQFAKTLTFGGRDGFSSRGSAQLNVIAAALGIDATALQTELEAGKTVADIATGQNIEISVVIDAVAAARQETLAAAVTDGKLTQAQADAQLELYKANLTERFSQTWEAGRGDGSMGGGRPGNNGPMGQDGQGNGGRGDHNGQGGNRPGGNGAPVPPDGSAPAAPDATPEATAEANA